MSDINSTLALMHWPQTGATHYHAQLGLPDKVCAIKGLVVSYLCCSMANIDDLWDIYGFMDNLHVHCFKGEFYLLTNIKEFKIKEYSIGLNLLDVI